MKRILISVAVLAAVSFATQANAQQAQPAPQKTQNVIQKTAEKVDEFLNPKDPVNNSKPKQLANRYNHYVSIGGGLYFNNIYDKDNNGIAGAHFILSGGIKLTDFLVEPAVIGKLYIEPAIITGYYSTKYATQPTQKYAFISERVSAVTFFDIGTFAFLLRNGIALTTTKPEHDTAITSWRLVNEMGLQFNKLYNVRLETDFGGNYLRIVYPFYF